MKKNKHKKIIFLDRDGTIIRDKNYMHKIKDLEFLPHAIEGLKKIQELGYEFIIVSNQAGVAKKYYTFKDMMNFHDKVTRRLSDYGITILASYFCTHHPKITGLCQCRKPNTGMFKKASKTFDIDPTKSIFAGDKDCDIKLGQNLGGVTFHINNGQYPITLKPDYSVKNLLEAYNIIKNLYDYA